MCKKNSICTTILSNLWKVQISEDWYLRGSYSCYLEVFITNKEGKSIQNTLFVNSDDRDLEDAVENFNLNYIATPIREFGE